MISATAESDMINFTNLGRPAIVVPINITLKKIACTRETTTFEYLSARATSGGPTCVIMMCCASSPKVPSLIQSYNVKNGLFISTKCLQRSLEVVFDSCFRS